MNNSIFGVTLQPLPTLANLQKLDTQVRELTTKYSGEVANYVSKLRITLPQICGGCNDLPRFKTAARMNALCTAIQQTRKPLDLFESIRIAQTETSAAGMGVVFKQSSPIHRALDQVRFDVFERLGQVQDEPRASVAQGLRRQIQDAMEADEHSSSRLTVRKIAIRLKTKNYCVTDLHPDHIDASSFAPPPGGRPLNGVNGVTDKAT